MRMVLICGLWMLNHVIKTILTVSPLRKNEDAQVLQADEEGWGQRKGGDQHLREVWSFSSKCLYELRRDEKRWFTKREDLPSSRRSNHMMGLCNIQSITVYNIYIYIYKRIPYIYIYTYIHVITMIGIMSIPLSLIPVTDSSHWLTLGEWIAVYALMT